MGEVSLGQQNCRNMVKYAKREENPLKSSEIFIEVHENFLLSGRFLLAIFDLWSFV